MTKFEEPTKRGNSRKHLVEVCEESLRRFRTDHLDFFFGHRPDFDTPVEEVVITMNNLIRQGKILYWGTSDHPPEMLMAMHAIAREMGLEGPHMEQTWYNMLGRKRIEDELVPLFDRYGMGATVYQPLHGGILTGKYQNGIPEGSRLEHLEWTRESRTEERLAKVREIGVIAAELGLSMPVFAVAWVLKNPNVSTAILGASRPEQIVENVKAVEAQDKLTEDVMQRIRVILGDQLQI
jgi:aryl-alcohol dehydrogenase-like predicted oxidoreductase